MPRAASRRLALGLALGVGGAIGIAPDRAFADDVQVAQEYDAHAARAAQLLQTEQYVAAIKEIEAAYALRQLPQWLFLLAQAHQRLGHASEARLYYQRYLVSAGLGGSGPADQQREAAQRLEELNRLLGPEQFQGQGQADPAAGYGNLPYRVEVRPHHRGMLAAGWSMLGIGYAAAFATGTAFAVLARGSSDHLGTAGGMLLIPVAGPLVSSAVYYQGILYWGLPWLLIDLPLQVSGLALIIKGYTTKQSVVVPNTAEASSVRFTPYLTPGGGGLAAAGQF